MKKEKKKAEFTCKYCGANTTYKDEECINCKIKKKIMHGWNWEYNPKEKIKI